MEWCKWLVVSVLWWKWERFMVAHYEIVQKFKEIIKKLLFSASL